MSVRSPEEVAKALSASPIYADVVALGVAAEEAMHAYRTGCRKLERSMAQAGVAAISASEAMRAVNFSVQAKGAETLKHRIADRMNGSWE